MNREQSINDKILSYFNGNLSSSGEAELFEWINQDPKNLDFFFRIKNEIEPEEIKHELLSDSYAELRNRLFISSQFLQSQPRKIRKLYILISRLAALLFVVVALSFSLAWMMTNLPKKDVVWFETDTSRGEKVKLILPDGSKVWMNSESSLSYPANFMDGNRNVKLKGEAYFEVAKHNGSVFTVETPDYNVRVLGTKFNLMAYENFNRTETTLIEGKIEIQKGKQIIDVAPGQTFTYKDNQFFTKETKATKSSRWKDDVFDFEQITFQEMVIRLERWYDVDIEIKNPELNQIIYSGVFKNEETFEEVLNTFKLTMPITYTKDDFRKYSIQMNN